MNQLAAGVLFVVDDGNPHEVPLLFSLTFGGTSGIEKATVEPVGELIIRNRHCVP